LNKPNISIFEEDLALSPDFTNSWISTISRYPRMMPYISQTAKSKEAKENILITGLERELSKHVADVSKKNSHSLERRLGLRVLRQNGSYALCL